MLLIWSKSLPGRGVLETLNPEAFPSSVLVSWLVLLFIGSSYFGDSGESRPGLYKHPLRRTEEFLPHVILFSVIPMRH